jgi:hypothetical protein
LSAAGSDESRFFRSRLSVVSPASLGRLDGRGSLLADAADMGYDVCGIGGSWVSRSSAAYSDESGALPLFKYPPLAGTVRENGWFPGV